MRRNFAAVLTFAALANGLPAGVAFSQPHQDDALRSQTPRAETTPQGPPARSLNSMQDHHNSMMGRGSTGRGMMGSQGMMGGMASGMMGSGHSGMMGGGQRPNEQWQDRRNNPSQ